MVSPAETAAVTAFMNNAVTKLFDIIGVVETYKMIRELRPDSQSLINDLAMIAASLEDGRGEAGRTAVVRRYTTVMRQLMLDMEDCIEKFAHRMHCKKEQGPLVLRWAAHGLMIPTCYRFAAEIKALKKRAEEIRGWVSKPPGGGGGGGDRPARGRRAAADHGARNPVGIAKPKEELLALLGVNRKDLATEQQPRVVAIVGFGGVGKTTLARAAYDAEEVAEAFPCRSWVDVRSLEHGDADGILEKIHEQLLPGEPYSKLSLTTHIKNCRYLFVLDDIDRVAVEDWEAITEALEGNSQGSRLVVTTAIHSTANRCSKVNGYVYKMRTLELSHSRSVALGGRVADELVHHSEKLLRKCDGLPLALVSVARELDGQNEPTGAFCEELCSRLGSYLEGAEGSANFGRLQEVLMDNYTSLPNLTVMTCLLYLGIFPADCPLRKNVIIRRWIAEGYARTEDIQQSEQAVANGNFKTFINRNIIQPVEIKSDTQVKTCKTHGILHEFLLHKSMCERFVMGPHATGGTRVVVRHLFVQDDAGNYTGSNTALKLSRVRSLTVRGHGGGAISCFGKYNLIRVLDLEDCTDVNNSHLGNVCKLWNLRYLSLGRNVTELPKTVAQLKLLETLAVSKAVLCLLPEEIIGLPCLTSVIGKFKLLDENRTRRSEVNRESRDKELEQLCRKSKLETLSGFVADGGQEQGFLQLMVHMQNLKKIKIWCESTGNTNKLNNDLTKGIQWYIKAPNGEVRSLTIDFNDLPSGSLHAFRDLYYFSRSVPEEGAFYLSSMKLRGNLSTSVEFISALWGLRKLCLDCPSVSGDLLSTLSRLHFLISLQLTVKTISENLVITGFRSLRHLRFVLQHPNPVLLKIEEGSLPELVSLWILCKHNLSIDIKKLKKLQEIKLCPDLGLEERHGWEAAAKNHPNKPNVLPFCQA